MTDPKKRVHYVLSYLIMVVGSILSTFSERGGLETVVLTWINAGTLTTDTYLNDSHGRRVEVAKNGAVEQRFMYDEHRTRYLKMRILIISIIDVLG